MFSKKSKEIFNQIYFFKKYFYEKCFKNKNFSIFLRKRRRYTKNIKFIQCNLIFSNFYKRTCCLELLIFWEKLGQKIINLKRILNKTDINLKLLIFFSKKFKRSEYLNESSFSKFVDEKNSGQILKKKKLINNGIKKLPNIFIKFKSFQKKFKFKDKHNFLENLLKFFSNIKKISKNSIKILFTFFNLKLIYENLRKKIRLKL